MCSCKTKYHQFEGELAISPASPLSGPGLSKNGSTSTQCEWSAKLQQTTSRQITECLIAEVTGRFLSGVADAWPPRHRSVIAASSAISAPWREMVEAVVLPCMVLLSGRTTAIRSVNCERQLMARFGTSGPIKLCANRPIFCSVGKCG